MCSYIRTGENFKVHFGFLSLLVWEKMISFRSCSILSFDTSLHWRSQITLRSILTQPIQDLQADRNKIIYYSTELFFVNNT